MRPNQRTLVGSTKQTTYVDAVGIAKTDTISLPLDFALQRILLELTGTFDIAGGVSVLVEDASQALITEIRLDLTGDDGVETVFKMSGSDLYIKNFFDYSVQSRRTTATAVAGGNLFGVSLIIDFRLAKNDPDDASVAIPLYALSSADLVITYTTALLGYGTNTDDWSLTGELTLFEFIPETAQEKADFLKNPLLKQISKELTLENATGEEERDRDIVVGQLIRRVILVAKTNAGLRSDVQIDDYTLETATLTFMKQLQWEASKSQDKIDYKLPTFDGNYTMTGVTIIDFARAPVDETGAVIGFDARGMKQGDLKLTFDKLVAQPKIRYIQESVI